MFRHASAGASVKNRLRSERESLYFSSSDGARRDRCRDRDARDDRDRRDHQGHRAPFESGIAEVHLGRFIVRTRNALMLCSIGFLAFGAC